MNTKDIAPWIFWIVCGVLTLVLLALAFVMEPTDAKGKTADQLKKAADGQLESLNRLRTQANTSPYGRTFNPENPDDLQSLTNDHVVPVSWAGVLEPFVRGYDTQIHDLKAHLVGRSDVLRGPIHSKASGSTPNSTDSSGYDYDWYQIYMRKSAELLRAAATAGFLVVPENAALESDRGIRGAYSLFTKDANVPPSTDHERLTRSYRLIEHILTRVILARGRIVENPISAAVVSEIPQATVPARLLQLILAESDEPLGGQMSGLGVGRRATLKLEGPMAALQAAIARLEGNEKVDRPITIVAGLDLQRKPSAAPGALRDLPAEDLRLEIRIVVLDFSQLASEATP